MPQVYNDTQSLPAKMPDFLKTAISEISEKQVILAHN